LEKTVVNDESFVGADVLVRYEISQVRKASEILAEILGNDSESRRRDEDLPHAGLAQFTESDSGLFPAPFRTSLYGLSQVVI
jgi:hypothetical protein